MDFEVSEKMATILKMVSEFMRDEVFPLEGEMLHGSADELTRQVAAAQVRVRQMGLWAPNHPVEYGGLGLDMV
jgi:alkylation response protein AidB-like acyl-CoA dehydrogenase